MAAALLFRPALPAAEPDITDIRTTAADSLIYCRIMQTLMPVDSLTSGGPMVKAALEFLGTPYAAGTLETIPERLTVNLRETDCILFVETCTAMTVLIKNSSDTIPSFRDFCETIRRLRYRDGKTDGYASRLHYTSEWLQQAEDKGILKEITHEYGMPLRQKFSFMSSHSGLYPQLKNNPGTTAMIRAVEERLDTAAAYYQIPADDIPAMEQNIKDGDIICFTSRTEGLDITHVAIAYRNKDGALHFIHASSKAGKVIIEPSTLSGYCRTGIRIARLNE